MQRVIEEEGMQGLWRGNTVNVLRMIPNKGVLHMTNDMYKDAIKSVFDQGVAALLPQLLCSCFAYFWRVDGYFETCF